MDAGKEEARTARLIYLASPYTHADPSVMEARYIAVCKKAAELMMDGHVVFSPIAHSHPLAAHMPAGMGTDHAFWMRQCLPMLARCDELLVLRLSGWEASRGIRAEIAEAERLGKPVGALEP